MIVMRTRFSIRILLAFLLPAIALASCKALEDLTTFHIKTETEFSIPSSAGINVPLTVATPDVTTNSSQEFKNNNSNADLVKEAYLEKLTLTIKSPSGKTFKFLKSVRLYLEAEGLPKVEIANQSNIDNSIGNILEMNTLSVDLKEYVKKDKYTLSSEVVTDETLLENVEITSVSLFRVRAGIL